VLSGNNLNHSEKIAYCSAFVFFLKNEETMTLGEKKTIRGIKLVCFKYIHNQTEELKLEDNDFYQAQFR